MIALDTVVHDADERLAAPARPRLTAAQAAHQAADALLVLAGDRRAAIAAAIEGDGRDLDLLVRHCVAPSRATAYRAIGAWQALGPKAPPFDLAGAARLLAEPMQPEGPEQDEAWAEQARLWACREEQW